MVADRIQVRRDTDADWLANDPTLAQGEIGFVTDTDEIAIGDGSTAFSSLSRFGPGDPAGELLYAETTSDVGSIDALDGEFDLVSDTVTIPTGRKVKLTAMANYRSSDSASKVVQRLYLDGTVYQTSAVTADDSSGGLSVGICQFVRVTGVSGAVTAKVTAEADDSAGGTITASASATQPISILVEDIGAA